MSEDLNLHGNELNYFTTYFNVGCTFQIHTIHLRRRSRPKAETRRRLLPRVLPPLDCIFLVPSQIILTYVRPSLWLPGLELGWGGQSSLDTGLNRLPPTLR